MADIKGWKVTIKAIVTKTIEITEDEAESEAEAIEIAHTIFSTVNNDTPEKYEQETESVEEAIFDEKAN
jgi:hypothetical protein